MQQQQEEEGEDWDEEEEEEEGEGISGYTREYRASVRRFVIPVTSTSPRGTSV